MSLVVTIDLLENETVARKPLARRKTRAPVLFRRSGKRRSWNNQRATGAPEAWNRPGLVKNDLRHGCDMGAHSNGRERPGSRRGSPCPSIHPITHDDRRCYFLPD